jgi:hypothetical protein
MKIDEHCIFSGFSADLKKIPTEACKPSGLEKCIHCLVHMKIAERVAL